MDETVTGALDALGLTRDNAPLWQYALRQVQEESQGGQMPDWDALRHRLGAWAEHSGLPAGAAQHFLEYAAHTNGTALVEQIATLSEQHIDEYCANAGWSRLLSEHGADWANYNGSQSHWEYHRDQFYSSAAAIDPHLYAMVLEQLAQYDSASPRERYRALLALGLPVDLASAEQYAHGSSTHGPVSFEEMSVEEIEEMILSCS